MSHGSGLEGSKKPKGAAGSPQAFWATVRQEIPRLPKPCNPSRWGWSLFSSMLTSPQTPFVRSDDLSGFPESRMFPACCTSEIRRQTKAGINLRAQPEVPEDLSGSSSVGGPHPPPCRRTEGLRGPAPRGRCLVRVAEGYTSRPETGTRVFNAPLTCCVTRTSRFTSPGLSVFISSMGQVWERIPTL